MHHAEFLAGDLRGAVSLFEMMEELGADAFASTSRNAGQREGNINPRRAYMRRAEVELSPRGHRWLAERLEGAFARYGKLPPAELATLDWPR